MPWARSLPLAIATALALAGCATAPSSGRCLDEQAPSIRLAGPRAVDPAAVLADMALRRGRDLYLRLQYREAAAWLGLAVALDPGSAGARDLLFRTLWLLGPRMKIDILPLLRGHFDRVNHGPGCAMLGVQRSSCARTTPWATRNRNG